MIFTSKLINEDNQKVMLLQPELLNQFEEDTNYVWQFNKDGSFNVTPIKGDINEY